MGMGQMTMWQLAGGVVAVALFIMGVTAVSNFLLFPRLRQDSAAYQPLVSVLVPARNEAQVIGRTVSLLLAQAYPHLELIVLDDHSEDETAVLGQSAAGDDPRFRLISGQSLPPGWLGKNWACHQLAQAAQGELLIFTDADVQWQPEALPALVAAMQPDGGGQNIPVALPSGLRWRDYAQRSPDLLTVWPTQQTVTWAERLVVPTLSMAILAYLPLWPVHYTRWAAFAAANGQCLAFRRAAYTAVGGHAAVRDHIVEDVALARRIKAAGQRLQMVDGHRLIACRMYDGWDTVRDGFAKNMLAGHGQRVWFLAVSTLFHWLVFLFPWVWWLATGAGWGLGLGLVGVGLRAATAVFTHQRPLDALLMPISVLLMTRIALQSIWWQYRGGPRWKGRVAAATTP